MTRSGSGVSWLALLVALAALFLAWKAYERSGGNLHDDFGVLSRDVSIGDDAPGDWHQELEKARRLLTKRRSETKPGDDLTQLREDVERMRESLAKSVRNTSADARAGWRETDADLKRVEQELREKNAQALKSLDETLEKMKREMKPETKPE